MHIAIVTAGGAGMFCGSCMHDNTWAHALMRAGCEVSLIPTYTPVRVDEENLSLKRVFFGGINVYLNDRWRWWNRIPRALTSWLDHPRIIRWATQRSISNDARELGHLTISMLQGTHGPHRSAVRELTTFIADSLRPDVVIFSNVLLAGAIQDIKQHFHGPVVCVLQGDDIFLDSLSEEYRQPAIDLIRDHSVHFDGFLTHSEFYREYMAEYLGIKLDRFQTLPLGIRTEEHTGTPRPGSNQDFCIGYFARIAPEKGLHHLAKAFPLLREHVPHARLRIGGYLSPQQQDYFQQTMATMDGHPVEYIGSPDTVEEKVAFLQSLDLFSVPTEFLEPKGLYVLEALANGVPVVQPAHGSFPETIRLTEGGLLVPPRDPLALAEGLAHMADPQVRSRYAQRGHENVRKHFSEEQMAARTIEILSSMLPLRMQ